MQFHEFFKNKKILAGVGVSVTEMRCRSMFYTSLGRLLMVDLGEDEEKFDAFMAPLTQAFENLGSVLLNSNSSCNTEEVKLLSSDIVFSSILLCL